MGLDILAPRSIRGRAHIGICSKSDHSTYYYYHVKVLATLDTYSSRYLVRVGRLWPIKDKYSLIASSVSNQAAHIPFCWQKTPKKNNTTEQHNTKQKQTNNKKENDTK